MRLVCIHVPHILSFYKIPKLRQYILFSISHHILFSELSLLHHPQVSICSILFNMRTALFVSALVGLAAAAPRPQDIDFEVVDVSTIECQGQFIGADVPAERRNNNGTRSSSHRCQPGDQLRPGRRSFHGVCCSACQSDGCYSHNR